MRGRRIAGDRRLSGAPEALRPAAVRSLDAQRAFQRGARFSLKARGPSTASSLCMRRSSHG